MNDLYTFIMDYLGGTYISQIKAHNKEEAMRLWIEALNIEEINGFSLIDKQKIIKNNFLDEDPVVIQGMENVWCFGVNAKKGYAMVNFVKTKKK